MKISVFGLGYVGTVSAGCLSEEGHTVIGVDPIKFKVDLINKGKSPIIEKDIENILKKSVNNRKLFATTDCEKALSSTDISIVCVGTPSQVNGNLDLKYLRRTCEEIGKSLNKKKDWHVVVIRSTILPGTMRKIVIPILEEYSRKKSVKEFGVCNNPEFLREGTAVYDFYNPPKTVIGATDLQTIKLIEKLYKKIKAPLIRTEIEIAEMIKYVDNIWHALKVAFANEIGIICKNINVDSHEVMDIFCKDTKLNISSSYLKPGFAFGGSCLPKDIRAMAYKGKTLDLNLPILNSILPSNELQIERGLNMVIKKEKKRVGFLGFSFKAGTDDLRESPVVEMIERLIGKGYELRLYDRDVNLAAIVGANRNYILNKIPHLSRLMVGSIKEILSHAETIVIGNNDPEFQNVFKKIHKGQNIVDLTRIFTEKSNNERYEGICW